MFVSNRTHARTSGVNARANCLTSSTIPIRNCYYARMYFLIMISVIFKEILAEICNE